jgi:dCMP deaminase
MAKLGPRNVPSKDEKYMGLAFWLASFSKDPHTQMGCYIINDKNEPLGFGFNGPPRAFKDDDLDWSRPTKYAFMRHSEANAIQNKTGSIRGAIVYVTGKPCKSCMLELCSHGVREVIYYPYKSKDKNSEFFSAEDALVDELAKLGNVSLRKFEGNLSWMRDRIKVMEGMGIFG